jgi:hypothetical protein
MPAWSMPVAYPQRCWVSSLSPLDCLAPSSSARHFAGDNHLSAATRLCVNLQARAERGAETRVQNTRQRVANCAADGCHAFDFYTHNFADYNAVYARMGAMIMFKLWLYLYGLVILVGSKICVWVEHCNAQGNGKGEKCEGNAAS